MFLTFGSVADRQICFVIDEEIFYSIESSITLKNIIVVPDFLGGSSMLKQ